MTPTPAGRARRLSPAALPPFLRPWLQRYRIDFRPRRPPSASSVALATVVAVVASLAADAMLVSVGVSVYPQTRGYSHFQFSDYSRLTVIGVLVACAGWLVVARVSSQPKWLFLRAAVAITIVLFLPDAAIWFLGQSARAVFVLVWMHVAIAVVTYLSMILLAPVRGGALRH